MFIIGIAGGSGAGKTTFTKKIVDRIEKDEVQILHMDSYYLPRQPESNYTDAGKPNFDHPNAFDWKLLKEHLSDLKMNKEVDTPVYDFEISRRTSKVKKIGPCKVLILEGIFTLFDKEVRDLLDIKCYLHVESDIRFTRRLHRDVKERGRSLESVIEQYYDTVRPMHNMFLEPQAQYADFTIGEETCVAATILAAQINHIINNN